MTDAVVIGAGPNGLVAANLLADAGWSVVVLEAAGEPGGAVRSMPGPADGFVADFGAAFFPLAAASPAITSLRLEEHGLRWRHAPAVLAHPLPDGRCAVLHADLERTVSGLAEWSVGDGEAWRRLVGRWQQVAGPVLAALVTPFPPVRAGWALARTLGVGGVLRQARFALLPVRRMVEEEFAGEAARLLLTGCALHADLTPDSAGGAALGVLLAMLGQQVGFPVPEGGAGELTAALVRRLASRGGQVRCRTPVTTVVIRRGRAVAVRTAAGDELPAARAVIATVPAPHLYADLVGWEHLPNQVQPDLRRFHWDYSTVKVDWALRGPVPWHAAGAANAGTVHVGTLEQMSTAAAQLAGGWVPTTPFLLLGQMTVADPTRSPAGTHALWGYTRVPRTVRGDAGGELTGDWDGGDGQRLAERIEAQLERYAPGFSERIIARRVTTPAGLETVDPNLVGGAIHGGTAAIHQQLVFRPTPGLGRPETPITGLYLGSASVHPGGGVHGGCGASAARAALAAHRRRTARVIPALTRFAAR